MPSAALFRNKAVLEARLREVPRAPGIYRFYDAADAIVYVGKSVCLRDRVRSYFSGKASDRKLRRLRQEVVRLDWRETGSELEALLLESRLVKLHQPRFNVLLRGFVPLPYVRVNLHDPFPLLQITRAPERDGATYYGPFHNQGALEAAVGAMSDTLKLRDCTISGNRIHKQRPCYRLEFGTCSGPCVGEVTSTEYGDAVRGACAVLEGQEQPVLEILRGRMALAADRLQFELAARLRDAMKQIEAVSGRHQAILSAIRELSLIAVCPSSRDDSLCVLVIRSGRLVLQEDLARAELLDGRSRRKWALRFLEVCLEADRHFGSRIDATLLDEVQIITAWMRQRTREGCYWEVPAGRTHSELVPELSVWLNGRLETAAARQAA
jgi:excinuclease UvrABC nuclease subunit